MSGTRRRVEAVGDRATEWLDEALAGGMTTAEAAEVLQRVWIPRLVRASRVEPAE